MIDFAVRGWPHIEMPTVLKSKPIARFGECDSSTISVCFELGGGVPRGISALRGVREGGAINQNQERARPTAQVSGPLLFEAPIEPIARSASCFFRVPVRFEKPITAGLLITTRWPKAPDSSPRATPPHCPLGWSSPWQPGVPLSSLIGLPTGGLALPSRHPPATALAATGAMRATRRRP